MGAKTGYFTHRDPLNTKWAGPPRMPRAAGRDRRPLLVRRRRPAGPARRPGLCRIDIELAHGRMHVAAPARPDRPAGRRHDAGPAEPTRSSTPTPHESPTLDGQPARRRGHCRHRCGDGGRAKTPSAPCAAGPPCPAGRRAMGFAFSTTWRWLPLTALERRWTARVAVVDFDAHHGVVVGNIILAGDPRVPGWWGISSNPFHPYTGEQSPAGQHGERAAGARVHASGMEGGSW